jgi:shikimate dehydrogenase
MSQIDASQAIITGGTRLFAIIGDPIRQVGSPRVFNPIMARNKVDAVLVPMRIAPADLGLAVAGLKAIGNLDGLIITIPHKMAMMALVDEVSPTGRLVGAINAVRRDSDGRWVGDMFDGRGCVRALKDQGDDPAGRSALLVGAGGAGSAVACALAEAGVKRMTVCDVDLAKAERLARVVAGGFPGVTVAVGPPASKNPKGYDLVVNCTPLGMKPEDPPPVDLDALDASMAVVDIVLKPEPTPLLAAAAARGCHTLNGHRMLQGQAAEVARFFGFG